MKKPALFIIRFYQKNLSSYKKLFIMGGCRFTPTCSEYSYIAIDKYGFLKGLYLSFKRVLKCNPGSLSGFDPLV